MLRSIVVTTTALLLGCGGIFGDGAAPSPRLLYGRRVEIHFDDGSRADGELLAVGADTLWISTAAAPAPIVLARIHRIRAERHAVSTSSVLGWTIVGAVATGIGMTAACTSVSEGCGGVFVVMALPWALWGGIATASVSSSRWEDVLPVPEALAPFARYPQGWPADRPTFTPGAPPPDPRESPAARAPARRPPRSGPGS